MASIGPYRIRGLLKSGGEAEVFKGVRLGDLGFEHPVAIKRLRRLHDEDAVRSFIDEARVLSQLDHPNIVSILDFGVEAERPYQILELVQGIDLADLLLHTKSGGAPIPLGLALHITIEVAHALHHAHTIDGLNVVHRDISPHNILVSWEGMVKIADFGIALFVDRTSRTRPGFARGKASYMAPEQMMSSDVDARADVFSIGCVLHEMVAGRSPVDSDGAREKLMLSEKLTLDPRVPEQIKPIVRDAVQPDRRHRPSSAKALADACELAMIRLGLVGTRERLRAYIEEHEERVTHDDPEPRTMDPDSSEDAIATIPEDPETIDDLDAIGDGKTYDTIADIDAIDPDESRS